MAQEGSGSRPGSCRLPLAPSPPTGELKVARMYGLDSTRLVIAAEWLYNASGKVVITKVASRYWRITAERATPIDFSNPYFNVGCYSVVVDSALLEALNNQLAVRSIISVH